MKSEELLRLVSERLGARGAVVEPLPSQSRTGALALDLRWKGQRWIGAVGWQHERRGPGLRGRISELLLQAQFAAREIPGQPLPILVVPTITRPAFEVLRAFMDATVPGQAWCLIDSRGVEFAPGIEPLDELPGKLKVSVAAASGNTPNALFGDLGQWMAKLLLAPKVDPKWLTAPRDPIRNGAQLARVAGASAATTSRWLNRMRASGHIEDGRGGLELVRVRTFIEGWSAAARPARELALRFALPQRDRFRQVCELVRELERSAPPRASLSRFAAARALGLGFVSDAPWSIVVEKLDTVTLERLGLVATEPQNAHVRLEVTKAVTSVFKGRVWAEAEGGVSVPCCDVLQTWLDVRGHPARGAEQAAVLETEALADVIAGS